MILWLNPVGGASGDMLLGALIAAGAPIEVVRAAVASTGLTGWSLDVGVTVREQIAATQVHIRVTDDAVQRRADELIALARAAQPAAVARFAVDALTALAEAEATIHGVPVEQVHLHELGGHDTVVDVVGVAAALHALHITEVTCAPLPLGVGTVKSRHGTLPAPAPATLALLKGMTVTGTDVAGEMVTPTAAALLRATGTRFGPMPTMTVHATGYGAGTRIVSGHPNVLVAVLGAPHALDGSGLASTEPTSTEPTSTEPMTVIETNVDDVSGELLSYTVQLMLDLGAADAWLVPIVGKKGRPAHIMCVLAHDMHVELLEERLLAETGSLGTRRLRVDRRALTRSEDVVDIDGTPVRIKHGPYRSKAEHDDLAAIARLTGRPLREIADRATHDVRRRSERRSELGTES